MKLLGKILTALLLVALLLPTAILGVGAASSTYGLSSPYKHSYYFDNFSALELCGEQSTDTLAIALSQLGYHEGNSDSEMDGLNLSGNRNFVEYNRLYGKLDNNEGNGKSYGYDWCASFVNWCLRQARVQTAQSAAAEVSCQRWVAAFKRADSYHEAHKDYTPKSADLIFFKDAGANRTSTHVGLVLYVDGSTVYTVEGNTSNGSSFSQAGNYVCLKSYQLTDEYIVGFGSPDYDKNPSAKKVDYSGNTHSEGLYISAEEVTVFSEIDGESAGTIPAFHIFSLESTDGGFRTSYGEGEDKIEGFVTLGDKVYQVTAKSDLATYDIKYILPSGAESSPMDDQKAEGATVRISDISPRKANAKFLGWSKTYGSKQIDFKPSDKYSGNENLTLYAVFDEDLYTVVFKAPDGSVISTLKGFSSDRLFAPYIDPALYSGWDKPVPTYFEGDDVFFALPMQESSAEESTVEETTLIEESSETVEQTEAESESLKSDGGCGSAVYLPTTLISLGALCLSIRKKKNPR